MSHSVQKKQQQSSRSWILRVQLNSFRIFFKKRFINYFRFGKKNSRIGNKLSAEWWKLISTCPCEHFLGKHFIEKNICLNFPDFKREKIRLQRKSFPQGPQNWILRTQRNILRNFLTNSKITFFFWLWWKNFGTCGGKFWEGSQACNIPVQKKRQFSESFLKSEQDWLKPLRVSLYGKHQEKKYTLWVHDLNSIFQTSSKKRDPFVEF